MAKGKRGQVPEEERCRGKSRQSGLPCKRRRSPGSDYCIFHGGRVPKGGAHPGFKHGRRSKFMPAATLLRDYQRGLDDPTLTHHRDAIALLDALVQQALDDFDDAGTAGVWRSLRATWRKVKRARVAGDAPRLEEALDEMDLVIERATRQAKREEEVVKLLERRRRHAVAETERRLAEDRTFTYEQGVAFYRTLGEVINKHVKDPRARRDIYNDMAAIVGSLERKHR